MGFKKEGKFGARPSFGRAKPRFNDGPRKGFNDGPRKANFELFDTRCDKCGKDCQVPFKPTGSKPIFCRDCFGKNDGPKSFDGPKKFDSPRRSAADLDEIHEKLDKIMRALDIDQD